MKNFREVFDLKAAELKRAAEHYDRLAKEVEAMRITAQLLSDAQDPTPSEENKGRMSQPQMMRAVLADTGQEMHMSAILEGIRRRFGKKLNGNVMAAVIFRYAKRGSIFYKSPDKPNTWGLLEWRVAAEPKLPLGEAAKVQ